MLNNVLIQGRLSSKKSAPQIMAGCLLLCMSSGFAVAADKSSSPLSPDYDPQNTSMGDEQSPSSAAPPPAPSFEFGKIQGDVSAIRQALSEAQAISSNQAVAATVRAIVTIRPMSFGESIQQRLKRVPTLTAAVAGTASKVTLQWEYVPAVLMEVDTAGLDALVQLEAVGGIELDRELEPDLTSSRIITGADVVTAEGHEGGGYGGRTPWEVAIIDTGVRSTHQALSGKVVEEACFTTDASCPNGANSMIGAGAGAPCAYSGCYHGSHVAGIATGRAAGSEPGGNARDANVIAINVFQWNPATSRITAYTSSLISALNHVYDLEFNQNRRVAAVNMSLGGGSYSGTCDTASPSTTTIMSSLRGAGVLVVASAGNGYTTSNMGWPACITHVVSVGNTNDNDTVSSSSSVSSVSDLWAPGSSITAPGSGSDTQYITIGGTSMSAPQVAGSAAVMYDCSTWNVANVPASASVDDAVIAAILANGPAVTDNRAGGTVTMPRLDLLEAARTWNNNDDFGTHETLTGTSGTNLDYSHCATTEAGEIQPAGRASTWYQFTAPSAGNLTLSTCDAQTTMDTVIATFSGSSVGSLVQEQFNDDAGVACTHSGVHSTVVKPVSSGQVVQIAVNAFGTTSHGKFNLNYQFTPAVPMCNGLVVTVDLNVGDMPTNGSDVILGTSGNDSINALQGDDTVCGMGGDDSIVLGIGADYADGGTGNDTIYGNGGADEIIGGDGDDIMYGGGSADTIIGNAGADYLYGGSNNDTLGGGTGDDRIFGQSGHDALYGGAENDILYGGTGGDTVSGGAGDDSLWGQGGADSISGASGNDTLVGGSGPDSLAGGSGTDSCNGQAGNDTHSGCEVTSGFPSPPPATLVPGFSSELELAEAIDKCDGSIETCVN